MTGTDEKRPRGRPKSIDRRQTVDTAMRCYWREGPGALSINELCRRAQVSKPALYREFGGEDGLMDAVLERYRELALVPLMSMFADGRSLPDLLEELPRWLTADRDLPSGCLFAKLRTAPRLLPPMTRQRVEHIKHELRGIYEAAFRDAAARGEVRDGISPGLAARYLDTQITTVLSQMATGEEPEAVRAQARLAFASLLRNPAAATP